MLKQSEGLTKTDDESNTRFSKRYQQNYHSTFGALTESKHVFLQGSGVETRLRTQRPTRVLEIGFGLGLNCLLSADLASTHKTPLHYSSVEHLPIDASEWQELNYARWLKTEALADELNQLLSQSLPAPQPTLLSTRLGQHTHLDLYIQDATSSGLFSTLESVPKFDAIYLDAFSPEVNPECWTDAFFRSLASLLHPQGRLATYCVKGQVRRGLQSAGFNVHKYPGPKGKREVLFAQRSAPELA